MEKSGLSYHSLNSNTENFEVTEFDGDVFFNAKESESSDIERRVSTIVRTKSVQF